MENYKVETLIKDRDINERVTQLGQIISASYIDTNKLIVVGLLRGSFMFIADLVRKLDIPVEVDFITVSSYGSGMTSSGNVKILKDLDGDISGHDVLLVEDIVDTGLSVEALNTELSKFSPASIKICSLLFKPNSFKGAIIPHYVGFSIPNKFVLGYGIDYNQKGRNLKDLYQVKE